MAKAGHSVPPEVDARIPSAPRRPANASTCSWPPPKLLVTAVAPRDRGRDDLARTTDPRRHGTRRNLKHFRDFGLGLVFELEEHERRAQRLGELLEDRVELVARAALFEQSL